MSAAEIVGGAFFSTLFQALFDKLGSLLYRSFFQGSKVDERLLKDLRNMMLSANQLHDDAEDKQTRYPAVREWVFELQDAIDDAEQLLDRINLEALQYKQETKPESSRSKRRKRTPSTFDREIVEIRARLDRLVGQKDVLGLKGVRPLERLPAPLANESRVYGRDGDKGRIIELLLSDDLSGDKISVVSRVGMGGLGKTTLAQLVYDNNAVRDHFELKDTIYDTEQLLERINLEALRYKQESKLESSKSKKLKLTPSTFYQEIVEIRARLDRLVGQKDVLGLKGVRPLERLPAPLADESCVYGSDGDKGRIIEPLSDDLSGDKISVVSIVGMGGLGKTTLAQLVYDDNKVTGHFDLKAWVTVSDEFDILKVTQHIFLQVKGRDYVNDCLHKMQTDLREASKGKKFLLVLDDVWKRSYNSMDVLLSPFQLGARGSKIVVTTRDYDVAKKMRAETHYLPLMSDDDCWRLFEHVCKNDSFDSNKDLLAIAKDRVKKCKGVPLAIKSLASLLSGVSDREELERVLKNDIWESQSGILPSLLLSYNYLPRNLKRCFAYCSIFPKDHEFGESERKNLILLWMAVGLVQTEDVGDAYFEDLTSRSLFQRSSTDKSTYIMHDLVHDLAVYVSGDFCFRLEAGNKTNISRRTRHFSCSSPNDLENFEGLSKAKSLQTCMIYTSCQRSLSSVFLSSLFIQGERCLRAICLSRSSLKVLPESIGDLKHLRYLDLSGNDFEKLPDTLCGLYNLQTLLLAYCRKLSKLPADMGNLVNLRHLDVREVPLQEMPHEMGNLKDLRTLSKFVVGKNNSSDIQQLLRGLSHLQGKLEISGLNNVDGDVSQAILEDKKCLEEIKMRWETARDDADNLQKDRDRKVLGALKPHSNVKRLDISSYGGTTFPSWVGHHSYASITVVSLIDCVKCCSLPPLGQLSSLQFLTIRGCSGVVKIGDEFYGNSSFKIEPFRSLKRFDFEGMRELQEWTFIEGQNGGCFPRLEYLSIKDCPKLEMRLPDDFPQQTDKFFPALELLEIDGCPRLAQTFLSGNFQHLTSLKRLRISNDENLQSFQGEWLPTSLTSLEIISIPNLKELGGSYHHLVSLKKLYISSCNNLQFLPEEGLPSSLKVLHICNCPLLAQRCQRETGEYWPKIAHLRVLIERRRHIVEHGYSSLSNGRSRSQIPTASLLEILDPRGNRTFYMTRG